MTEEDVARLAGAIATAQGHSDPSDWAAKVVAAWQALGTAPAELATQEPTDAAAS